MGSLAIAAGITLGLYLALVALLYASGRRFDARALLAAVPDCLALLRGMLADPRVTRRQRLLIGALVCYLAMPLDLVPDFIPVVGQLDDVILVAIVLGLIIRGGGLELVRDNWPRNPTGYGSRGGPVARRLFQPG